MSNLRIVPTNPATASGTFAIPVERKPDPALLAELDDQMATWAQRRLAHRDASQLSTNDFDHNIDLTVAARTVLIALRNYQNVLRGAKL